MSIAVTGGTGFVGQALLDEGVRRGQDMRAMTRRDQAKRDGVTWVQGDLSDSASLASLAGGAEAMIHVAGVVNTPDASEFEAGNVAGTMNVIEACVAAGVPRFIFVSSLSAREPHLSIYGASKHRAEKLVKASGLDWTIIRPPAIYGPRDKEMLDLFRFAKWGVVPMPPEGRDSLIHVDDLARLLLDILPSGEDLTHCIFEPDDGRRNGWKRSEWAGAIGDAVGKRPRVMHLSRGILERVSQLEHFFRGDKAKLTLDRIGYMTHPDWVVSAEHAVPTARWEPQIPTREGLKATAEWYLQQDWL